MEISKPVIGQFNRGCKWP